MDLSQLVGTIRRLVHSCSVTGYEYVQSTYLHAHMNSGFSQPDGQQPNASRLSLSATSVACLNYMCEYRG